jgi:excisionase family DNA binding protein
MEETTPQTADASRRRERKAYSPDEAAELYGVGRSFIYEQIASGQLMAKKAGTRTLIKASVLEIWFDLLPLSIKVKRRSA